MFRYDPLSAEFKSVTGAVSAGAPVRLVLHADRRLAVLSAELVVWRDGESQFSVKMRWRGISEGFDEYETELKPDAAGLYFYFFRVRNAAGERVCAADAFGKGHSEGGAFIQLVTERDVRPLTNWGGGVMYQIFCDRFNIGSGGALRGKKNCVYRDDWGGVPKYLPDPDGVTRCDDFFGGNLRGVTEKLDYLALLGVTAIYLNPIFSAASNHKYDTGDYMKIDPLFGDARDFRNLCREAKKAGIKIVLDGVFNHTGSDSAYFNRYGNYAGVGAYQSKDSPYYKWYNFRNFPDEYDSWWGFDTLPAVNETEESFDNFINGLGGVAEHYLGEGADGWRLDVADELPDAFLENLRLAVKRVKPDAIIIGEVWENAVTKEAYGSRRRYFNGRQLDSVMNYPFLNAVLDFVRYGRAEAFAAAVNPVLSDYPRAVRDNLMNIIGTHDTARVLTVLGGDRGLLRTAAVLQFTLPGFPCVFYGDEAGAEGEEGLRCRVCYPWGREDKGLVDFYTALGRLRRVNSAFAGGDMRFIRAADGVVIYERYDGRNAAVVCVNRSRADFRFTVSGGGYRDAFTDAPLSGEVVLAGGEFKILVRG